MSKYEGTTSLGPAVSGKALVLAVPGYERRILINDIEGVQRLEIKALRPRDPKANADAVVLCDSLGPFPFKSEVSIFLPYDMRPAGNWDAMVYADGVELCAFTMKVIETRLAHMVGF